MLHVPPPGPADVAVRARADPPPVAVGPVEQVVAASGLLTGRPGGDLVPVQPAGAEPFLGPEVTVGAGVGGRGGQLAPGGPPGERWAPPPQGARRGDVVGVC